MQVQQTKKYGLATAIAMVVGIVIGSGVFFKAEGILVASGGNMIAGVLAWLIVGLIMIICSYTFAIMATKYEKVNGVVDYAEVTMGKKYSYLVGWFMTTIYYPSLTSVLAWVSARFFVTLFDWDVTGGQCMVIAGAFLILSYGLNALSPILAGKFQVSTTVIKLIPLGLMAIVGIVVGLANGVTIANFSTALSLEQIKTFAPEFDASSSTFSILMASVASVAFAYEGWIIATSINSELKDSKKNLPRALVIGSLIVVAVYTLYYIGISGSVDKMTLITEGSKAGFLNIFGDFAGTVLMVFIVISCLGTLNGLMLGCTRGVYSIAIRNQGPKPKMFAQIDPHTNMPSNSAIMGLILSGIWLVYFYGANLTAPWFGKFSFDSSEIPILTLYALYIPMFIMMMVKEKDLNVFKRFVMPALTILSCIFMVYSAAVKFKDTCYYYLIIFAVIMAIGVIFMNPKKSDRIEVTQTSDELVSK